MPGRKKPPAPAPYKVAARKVVEAAAPHKLRFHRVDGRLVRIADDGVEIVYEEKVNLQHMRSQFCPYPIAARAPKTRRRSSVGAAGDTAATTNRDAGAGHASRTQPSNAGAAAQPPLPATRLQHLPPELLLRICGHLDLVDVMRLLDNAHADVFARVGRKLKLHVMLPLSMELVTIFRKLKPRIVRLSSSCPGELLSKDLPLLDLTQVKHLKVVGLGKSLGFSALNHNDNMALEYLIEHVPMEGLESLTINWAPPRGPAIPLERLSNIADLQLWVRQAYHEEILGVMDAVTGAVQNLPSLKSLELRYTPNAGRRPFMLQLKSASLEKVAFVSSAKCLKWVRLDLPNCRDFRDDNYPYATYELKATARAYKILYHGCPKLRVLEGFDISHISRSAGLISWAHEVLNFLLSQQYDGDAYPTYSVDFAGYWQAASAKEKEDRWTTVKAYLERCKYPEQCGEPCCRRLSNDYFM